MALPSGLLEIGLPGDATLTIRQGDSFRQLITVNVNGSPADLSVGVTATLKIRDTIGGSVLATCTCTIPIGTDGTVLAVLTPVTTAALTVSGTTRVRQLGVWDLDLTDGTDVITCVGGTVQLYMQVTS